MKRRYRGKKNRSFGGESLVGVLGRGFKKRCRVFFFVSVLFVCRGGFSCEFFFSKKKALFINPIKQKKKKSWHNDSKPHILSHLGKKKRVKSLKSQTALQEHTQTKTKTKTKEKKRRKKGRA